MRGKHFLIHSAAVLQRDSTGNPILHSLLTLSREVFLILINRFAKLKLDEVASKFR